MTFGKILKKSREEKKLTQAQLGKILKTSYAVIGKYERDEMNPSIDVVIKLSKALNVSVGYLVGESALKKEAGLSSIIDSLGEPYKGVITEMIRALFVMKQRNDFDSSMEQFKRR
jgi:transcriptional regulator with XRE-family HTH domain